MDLAQQLESLVAGEDLSREQSRAVMQAVMRGEVSEPQIAGILVAIRCKGAAPQELAGFAEAMRESAQSLPGQREGLVDTAGTGGGCKSFNLSTAAAIAASAAGARIAKHGNRAISSRCGSADVLEALGVTLLDNPDNLARILDDIGIAFLFAPHHHPAMRHVGPVRKALGVRTVFNQLGPLANPAGASRQLIGVYEPDLMRPMAEALALLDAEAAYVVHGEDGLDEVSPCAGTLFCRVGGEVEEGRWAPEDFGQEPLPPEAIVPGETPAESAEMLREALTDSDSKRSAAIVPNAAVAVMLAGLEGDPKSAAERVRDAIASGSAIRKLEQLISATAVAE